MEWGRGDQRLQIGRTRDGPCAGRTDSVEQILKSLLKVAETTGWERAGYSSLMIDTSFLLFEVYYEACLKGTFQVHQGVQNDEQKIRQRLLWGCQPGSPQSHRPLLRHQDSIFHLRQIDLANVPTDVELKLVER